MPQQQPGLSPKPAVPGRRAAAASSAAARSLQTAGRFRERRVAAASSAASFSSVLPVRARHALLCSLLVVAMTRLPLSCLAFVAPRPAATSALRVGGRVGSDQDGLETMTRRRGNPRDGQRRRLSVVLPDASNPPDEGALPPASSLSSSSSSDAAAETETKTERAASSSEAEAEAEAEALRRKARELMAEADAAEVELRAELMGRKGRRDAETDAVIAELIAVAGDAANRDDSSTATTTTGTEQVLRAAGVTTESTDAARGRTEEEEQQRVEAIAAYLRTKEEDGTPLTTSKLLRVAERIYERERAAEPGGSLGPPKSGTGIAPAPVDAAPSFNIGDTSNSAEVKERERSDLDGLIDRLIDALELTDVGRQASDGVGAGGGAEETGDSGKEKKQQQQHYGVTSNAANTLRSRMKDLRRADDELFRRKLASDLSASRRVSPGGVGGATTRGEDETVEDFVRRTMTDAGGGAPGRPSTGGVRGRKEFNATRFMLDVVQVPMWVPTSLLPFVAISDDELDVADLKRVRSEVLTGSRFYCTGWDSFRLAAVYRGNFVPRRAVGKTASTATAAGASEASGVSVGTASGRRANADGSKKKKEEGGKNESDEPISSEVFADVRERLAKSGLDKKLQLFLIDDPEWRPGYDERQPEPRPVILAVPTSVVPEQGTERGMGKKALAGLSILSTVFTTFAYAVSCYALNPAFFKAVVDDNDVSALVSCVPIFLGVFALLAVHEVAHAVAARITGIRIGLPIPLPSLQIGTFGSITPLRSFPESRKHLLDLALSGPAVTLLLSALLMIGGIVLTVNASAESLAQMPVVPAALMKSSLLIGAVISAMAPKIMMLPLSQPIPVHSLFLVGLAGLVSSAVNLLPIGRLDGGRAFTAAFGMRKAYLISLLTLLVLAISALSGSSTVSIFWGLLVVLFQRQSEIPIRDEITGIDDIRLWTFVSFLSLAALVLAPFPGGPGAL